MRLTLAAAALGILFFSGCGGGTKTVTKQGTLNSGTLAVTATSGKIEAYPPAVGEPSNRYTFQAYGPGDKTATINEVVEPRKTSFTASATGGAAADVLVRVPQGVHAELRTTQGDIHVSDVNAPVDAVAAAGSIKIQIPSYANARTGRGNISATIGDVNWPGALHFESDTGDVEVWIPAVANARVDLHTDHGTVFTDFNLHGSASGDAETIAGDLGSGGSRSVVVRVKNGNIRLLKLVPQM